MPSKWIIAVVVCWVAVEPVVAADEFFRDLRTPNLDATSFERVGSGAEVLVQPGSDGLRIQLLDGKNHEPTGVTVRRAVAGNFEITTTYQMPTVDVPATGYGVGVGLYVETDSPTKEGITLERFVMPQGAEVFASTRASVKDGKRTYTSRRFPAQPIRSGQLRLSRRDGRISALVAEGTATTFRKLQTVEVAPGDLTYIRLAADTGGATARLDATFGEIRIKTTDLLPEPPDDPPPALIPVAQLPAAPRDVDLTPVLTPPQSPAADSGSGFVLALALILIGVGGGIAYIRRRPPASKAS